jgi:hypothetical protein
MLDLARSLSVQMRACQAKKGYYEISNASPALNVLTRFIFYFIRLIKFGECFLLFGSEFLI